MATIRKRPGPRGRLVYQAQIIRSGAKPQYRTFDTKAAAQAWAKRVESAMDSGSWQDRTEGEQTTVAQAFRRYRLEITPHKAVTTAYRETWKIRHLASGLGDLALSRVTERDTADYIRARERAGASPATIAGELSVLGHLL